MKKNKQKETLLPITVQTGYYHTKGNRFENARQQIEKVGLYVQSIFNMIKLSTDAFETIGDRKVEQYFEDLRHLSEIGGAISDSLFRSTMAYLEIEEDEESEPVINENVAKKKKRRE